MREGQEYVALKWAAKAFADNELARTKGPVNEALVEGGLLHRDGYLTEAGWNRLKELRETRR